MAEATAVPTSSYLWDDTRAIHVVGSIAIGASPLTYATGGIACDILASMVDGAGLGLPLPGITAQPLWVAIRGISGFVYEWKASTKKLLIRSVAAVTPAGSIVNTVTVAGGAAGTALGISADADGFGFTKAAATQRTSTVPVVGVFTGTAQVAAALAELAVAAIPAGVSGDTISFNAIFRKLV